MRRRACILIEASAVSGRNPLVAGLRAELAGRGVDLLTWDPTGGLDLPPRPPAAELYLLKSDHPLAMAAAGCLHDAGAPCLNGYLATEAAQDKARALTLMSRAGLPVPTTRLVAEAADLTTALAGGGRFVKPLRGFHGIGASRLGPGEADRAGPGPWLVQEAVGEGDVVQKAYGVGGRVALRRMTFRPGVVDGARQPLAVPDPTLCDLACRAAEAAGLECFGADFVRGSSGPVLVDLNPFPGYRSVDEAPAWVADAVVAALDAP